MTEKALLWCVWLIRGWIQPWKAEEMPAMVADWLPAVDATLHELAKGGR